MCVGPVSGRPTLRSQSHAVPERLLIYHAGTGRTTFLACLKVTTVFGLAFFTFLVAPAYIIADKPLWQILGIVSCGIVPFIVASYTSSPFVVFVHLRLPAYARHPDRELLRRFVRNPPAGTQLDFTTMNLVGRPRLATVAISDLAPAHKRLGIVNLIDTQASARQTATTSDPKMARAKLGTRLMPTLAKQASRSTVTFSSRFPFVHLPPNTCFGAPASNNSRSVQYAWVWADLLASIQQRARKPDQNGPKSG
ncbi:hypothetical protein SEPCBS119000_005926 [Sporothrix epigloea]|uniref:Uncharacterized protein n=1 Tax=Sporothrix epigloea TaxID=1892477 RepID=A0ABP0E495_9PEZI